MIDGVESDCCWFFQSDLCCLSTCNLRLYMSYSTHSPGMVVLVPNRIAQPGTCWAHTSKCFPFPWLS